MIQNFYNDFKEFIKLLIKFNVEYLIVGGYAVSIYSRPKNTQDIDIWINPSRGNAEKLLKVIDEFGFGSTGITLNDLTTENQIVQFGIPPIRIDIMTSIDGVDFNKAYADKVLFQFDDIGKVSYISFEDLLTNKRKSDRLKDKIDLDWLNEYGEDN